MAPDEGSHEDVEKDMVAEDEGIDGPARAPRKPPMHTIDDSDGRR